MKLINNPQEIASKHPEVGVNRQAQIYNHIANSSDPAETARVLGIQLKGEEKAYLTAITGVGAPESAPVPPKAKGFAVPGQGLVPISGASAAKPKK